jgi:hypothetical protein
MSNEQGKRTRRRGTAGIVSLVAAMAMSVLAGSAQASTITVGSVMPIEYTATKFENVKTMFNTGIPERGSNLTSPVGGAIVRWKIQGAKGGPFYLRVLHPNGSGAYSSAGTSAGVTPVGAGVEVFSSSIPIHAGDQIGIDPTNPTDEIGIAAVPSASFGFIFPPPPDGATVPPNGSGSGEIELSAEVQPTPGVSSLSANFGSIAGGTTVVLTGTDLNGASAVKFGETPAASYTVDSETQITATAPPSTAPGEVPITVTTVAGTSAKSGTSSFSYRACVVPRLKRNSLRAAKVRIRHAGCKPGKVKKLNGATAKTGVVAGQGPKPGTILAPDSTVNFNLGLEKQKKATK